MGDSQGDIQVPRIQQPKQMIVRAPFAYIAGSADMNNPVCYLKSGDIVQVYTDVTAWKYTCLKCGGIISIHDRECSECQEKG